VIRVDMDLDVLMDLFVRVCGVARKGEGVWLVACTDDFAPRCMSEFEVEVRGFGTLRRGYMVVVERVGEDVVLSASRVSVDFVEGRTLRFCSCALGVIMRDLIASEVVRRVAL